MDRYYDFGYGSRNCVTEMCTLGCGARLTGQGMPSHLRDRCELRMLTCDYCKEEFKSRDLCAHGEKCPKMNVKCELKCGKTIRREDITLHQNNECGMVEETCKLYCGLKMKRDKLKIHMRDSCINRKIRCEHCKKDFKYCDMISHLDQCPKQVLSCELNCGRTLRRENMTQHLKRECGLVMMECKLRCGIKLTRGELKIHVTDTCMYRKIRCEHCVEYFKFCDISNHLEVCPRMIVPCELECGVVMCRENMAQHLEQECGLVEEMCELGCGMKLTRDELKIHIMDTCVQREIPCEHCKKDFKYCDMSIHLDECPEMEVLCKLNCGIKIIRDELRIHMDKCPYRKVRCEHCFYYGLKFCDMSSHLNVCPRIKLSCELKCGKIMCREDVSLHLEEYCPEKEIPCPFAKYSCYVRMKRKRMSKHLEKKQTEHLELKLSGLENIIAKQSIEIKQMVLEKHQENKGMNEQINSKLNKLEDRVTRIWTLNRQEEEKMRVTTINRLSEQINTLCSINSTTKLEWNIKDITDFVQILKRQPEQKQIGEFTLNVYFEKNSICVSFNNEHRSHQTTVVARFMISLYSNTKMRVIKQYKHDISQFLIGSVKREISCIPNSDVEEFSRIRATKDIILEMYVTVL